MESAHDSEKKNRALGSLSGWYLVSCKRPFYLYRIAHVHHSACVSAITRIYYSVKMFQIQDYTYYFSILDLWALVEIASAFLAACLPYSPKFFKSLKDSTLWSGFKNSMHLHTQAKTKSTPVDTRTVEHKPARFREGLSSLNALFKKHKILPDGTELTRTSMKSRKESNTEATHSSETSQNLESMRTIHTTTTEESGLAHTMPNPPN